MGRGKGNDDFGIERDDGNGCVEGIIHKKEWDDKDKRGVVMVDVFKGGNNLFIRSEKGGVFVLVWEWMRVF